METSSILLLLLAPFVGFLINIFFGKQLGKSTSGYIATLAIAISFAVTCLFFLQVNSGNPPVYAKLLNWMAFSDFEVSIGILLDQLSLLWLMFVTGIGTLIHLYSISYMHDDDNQHKFFGYLNLFVFFMMVLVAGSNLLVMFIGWEGVGLCSYLLIGFWYKNQDYNDAAKKAFIMNRIGDLGFLIGMFIIAIMCHSLEYNEIQEAVFGASNAHNWITIAALCLFIGATGKSAQLPLYTWLPDAMAGPTPVSALIHAATMVTAGIFMVTRMHFLFDFAPDIQNIMAIIGAFTALIAATIGLVQNDIKKVLAYSTVSQLGLMFLALGLGAYEVAVFHVITHAFFKACLFLGSGSVIHALHGEQDMRKMGGLKSVMKVTYITFLLSSLAISGIPPFSGFFSKDEILMTAFHQNIGLWLVASAASIMTAFYMFRLLFLTFFKDFRGTSEQQKHLHESPALMTVPLIILATLATVGGLISLPGNSWLSHFLAPVLGKHAHTAHHFGATEYLLMALAVLGGVIGIAIAYSKYIRKNELPDEDDTLKGLPLLLYRKYYLDEIYVRIFVQPLYALAAFFRDVVESAISRFVFALGTIAQTMGSKGKTLQNGSIGYYLFVFVIGFSLILFYLILA